MLPVSARFLPSWGRLWHVYRDGFISSVWLSYQDENFNNSRNQQNRMDGLNGLAHSLVHYDVIKWKHFPRHWAFVWGIHRSPVNSPHKGQWRGVLMFSLMCAWINSWVNNREAGDLRRHRALWRHCNGENRLNTIFARNSQHVNGVSTADTNTCHINWKWPAANFIYCRNGCTIPWWNKLCR